MLDLPRTVCALVVTFVLATGWVAAQRTMNAVFTVGATVSARCAIAANNENITLACTKHVSATVDVASSVAGDGDDPVWRPIVHAILSLDSSKVPVTVPARSGTPTVAHINF